jgi:16S rRNA (guanine527-N7)-methyltransferase
VALLREYAHLLLTWNRRTNLIARGDEQILVPRHIGESLSFVTCREIIPGALVLDLGSGGGLPGIAIKILRRDVRVVLLEAQRRKVLFLQEAIEALKLEGVRALCARAEALAVLPEWQGRCDAVVARGVTNLCTLWSWAAPLLAPQGVLVTLKGGDIGAEVRALAGREASVNVRLAAPPSCLVPPDKGRLMVIVRRGAQT